MINIKDLFLLSLQAWRSARDGCSILVCFGLPFSEVVFTVVEDLASLAAMFVHTTGVAWNDGAVIEELQESTTMLSQDDLLLSTLDGGGKFGSISLLEFLASLETGEH